MQRLSILCAALIGSALAWPVPGRAADPLPLAVFNFPPMYLLDGADAAAGKGNGDILIKALAAQIPERQVQAVPMALRRVFSELKAGQPVCFTTAVEAPERFSYTYATPSFVTPSVEVVTLRSKAAALTGPDGKVDLATLAANPAHLGSYTADRAFGLPIDNIIRAPANVALKLNASADPVAQLRMLSAGRVDYVLEYPTMLGYLVQRRQLPDTMVALPIRQQSTWVTVWALCPRTPWGKRAISDIDTGLQRVARSGAYQDILQRWLPASASGQHPVEIDQFIQRRARGSMVRP
ncbi:hypothetical protein JCM19000A_10740 [Silvimonas sp. JCM 19000]